LFARPADRQTVPITDRRMMKAGRRQFKLYLDRELWLSLCGIADGYGFRSANEMAVALLHLFVKRCTGAAMPEVPDDMVDEIDEMFRGLSDCELSPANSIIPKKIR
jgi:hypothetical protein